MAGAGDQRADAIVAGHICLDVIPTMTSDAMLAPGALVEVGAAVLATGGAVSNTGLALHRLGVRTSLMGTVGEDLFGSAVLGLLRQRDPALVAQMVVDPQASTSYSVVISPPGADRTFLHCPGANDSFCPDALPLDRLDGARLLHFGYPPIMRQTYVDGGEGMRAMFEAVKARGLTTSLDMSRPDPAGPSGRVDWARWLERVLPAVDLFLPSLDEIVYMIDRPRFDALAASAGEVKLEAGLGAEDLAALADRLIGWGAAVVVLKLGDAGLYVRTTADAGRLARAGGALTADREVWRDREILAPCFEADVVGTTGSGDCTIAGFLAAVLEGDGPEGAATTAVAVGASSVEAADATSGVCALPKLRRRLAAGWASRPVPAGVEKWRTAPGSKVRLGPRDRTDKEVTA